MIPRFCLRACRINAGLSQEYVADHFGIHVQTYRRYERDSRLVSFPMMLELCRIFQVDPAWIYAGTDTDLIHTIRVGREGVQA
ncbi:helix-turn-helix domain-containing protein [Aerococcus sanguinicola]